MLYAVLTQRDGHSSADSEPGSAILKRSLTLSLTNPKAILFYVSFFVQFIDVSAKTPGLAFFILALTLEIISFIYMSFFDPLRLFRYALREDEKEAGENRQQSDRPCVCRFCRPSGDAPVVIVGGRYAGPAL
ncbi:transport protein [Klebsiella michiganensis]|uniref:Transport protein n=1 Tax=Klebsiella michiganensis TaxID=1134687 RepID=A0A7H4N180_9ENTR|nr:transport protein [Klebsiella michiganensis]